MKQGNVLKRLVAGSVLALALVTWSSLASAANVSISVSGNPSQIKQGETKTFTISVSASGDLNKTQSPAAVTVDAAYTVGGGSGSPDSTSVFTYVCKNQACNAQAQPVSSQTYLVTGSVEAPIDLAPGTYRIDLSAAADRGLALPDPLPSFEIEVVPAGHAPSVTINSPENGGAYKVNEPVVASVEVVSDLQLDSVSAGLNDSLVQLTYDEDKKAYVANLVLAQPGENTFTVKACNAVGCGSQTSSFSVTYDFGGWLPPITTAKFQYGRTLPVKFTVNDYYGPTADARVNVNFNGEDKGQAVVLYNEDGMPFYQLDVKLELQGVTSLSSSDAVVGLSFSDNITTASKRITVR